MTHHIALYGKSGVGLTTLATNISASLIDAGFSVLFVGCDLVGNSASQLLGGFPSANVPDILKNSPTISAEQIIHSGYKGIQTVELAGGTTIQQPRSLDELSQALEKLKQAKLFEHLNTDFVIYDISGDNSFATLRVIMEQVEIIRLFVVTTADYKAMQTVNDVFEYLAQLNSEIDVLIPMGGLILNSISSSFEEAFVNDFAYNTNARTIGKVPRSLVVRQAELYGQTVIESKPLSNQSYYYRRLANQIVDAVATLYSGNLPQAMSAERMRSWSLEWADRIYALENGLVADGAAI